jgi:hypothetical protein
LVSKYYPAREKRTAIVFGIGIQVELRIQPGGTEGAGKKGSANNSRRQNEVS